MQSRTRLLYSLSMLAVALTLLSACAGAAPAAPTTAPTTAAKAAEPTKALAEATKAPEAPKATDAPKAANANAPASIKVGGIFALTGPTSEVSVPYSEGMKGYVDWINSKGGIGGTTKIDLKSQDYAYKTDLAEQAYSQYTTQDKVAVFMGWGTGDTEALRTKVAADKIPFMSASYAASLNDQKEAPYNFLLGTTYSDQMVIALQWVLSDWKAKGQSGSPKVAYLISNSAFGKSPVADGDAFAKANNIATTAIPMSGGTDLTPEITQAQQFGANYIVFQNTSGPAALAIKNAKSLGLTGKIQFICLNWCADENLIKQAGDAAEGTIGAIPFTPPSEKADGLKDIQDYAKAKNINLDDKGLHYVQGWWTMAVMAEGIKRTLDAGKSLTGENIKASLETVKDFGTGGITSPVTFTATDHRGTRALRLYQLKGGKWSPITDYIQAK